MKLVKNTRSIFTKRITITQILKKKVMNIFKIRYRFNEKIYIKKETC